MAFYTLTILALVSFVAAADCDQERGASDPSGTDIATALTSSNQLSEVCNGNFPSSNDTSNTFNHWCELILLPGLVSHC